MSCCNKEAKSRAAEAACCESKPDKNAAKTVEKSPKSGCGCDSSAESSAKNEEKKQSSCC